MTKVSDDFSKDSIVAVYGSLRDGLWNNHLLKDCEKLGECTVDGFEMISLGSYPAIYEVDEEGKSITCEVYKVNEEVTARRLDRLEGYPSFYDRQQIDTEHGKAWIYYFTKNRRGYGDVVESGDWIAYQEERRSNDV